MIKTKQKLRQDALLIRKNLLRPISNHLIFQIQTYLNNKNNIAFYCSLKHELSLKPLWTYILNQNLKDQTKKVFFPKVMNNTEMVMISIKSEDDLKEGTFGILEPRDDTQQFFDPKTTASDQEIDVIFVPGLMFGVDGSRLGYGKGFYDRFLQKHPYTKKIGVVWEELLIDSVPFEDHDIFMDAILTDQRLLLIK
ncbi:MAG: 5-formyltetrahydrofolate cyclo-ligase [Brevinema sp.]